MRVKSQVLAGLLLIASVAHAGSGGGEGFWSSLVSKLQKVTPTKKSTATTAVGGVRGAKNDDNADIYWKGKAKTVEVGEDELEQFKAAVAAKTKGDSVLALKQFEQFLRDFPQSSLRVDCAAAIDQLKGEQKLQPATAAPVAK